MKICVTFCQELLSLQGKQEQMTLQFLLVPIINMKNDFMQLLLQNNYNSMTKGLIAKQILLKCVKWQCALLLENNSNTFLFIKIEIKTKLQKITFI